jgi:hypothetical protein
MEKTAGANGMRQKAVDIAHKILTHNLVILSGGILLALIIIATVD